MDDGLDLAGGGLAAFFNFHGRGDRQAECAGEVGKPVVEGHKLPAGERPQRLVAVGLGGLVFCGDRLQVLRDLHLLVRIDGRKTVCDIPAHADGVRGIQPDVRVVSVLAGKGLNAGRGGNGLFRGLQRVLHKILQPEAV